MKEFRLVRQWKTERDNTCSKITLLLEVPLKTYTQNCLEQNFHLKLTRNTIFGTLNMTGKLTLWQTLKEKSVCRLFTREEFYMQEICKIVIKSGRGEGGLLDF